MNDYSYYDYCSYVTTNIDPNIGTDLLLKASNNALEHSVVDNICKELDSSITEIDEQLRILSASDQDDTAIYKFQKIVKEYSSELKSINEFLKNDYKNVETAYVYLNLYFEYLTKLNQDLKVICYQMPLKDQFMLDDKEKNYDKYVENYEKALKEWQTKVLNQKSSCQEYVGYIQELVDYIKNVNNQVPSEGKTKFTLPKLSVPSNRRNNYESIYGTTDSSDSINFPKINSYVFKKYSSNKDITLFNIEKYNSLYHDLPDKPDVIKRLSNGRIVCYYIDPTNNQKYAEMFYSKDGILESFDRILNHDGTSVEYSLWFDKHGEIIRSRETLDEEENETNIIKYYQNSILEKETVELFEYDNNHCDRMIKEYSIDGNLKSVEVLFDDYRRPIQEGTIEEWNSLHPEYRIDTSSTQNDSTRQTINSKTDAVRDNLNTGVVSSREENVYTVDAYVNTNTNNLNVRSGPGINSEVVTSIPKDSKVKVLSDSENGFVKVQYGNNPSDTGYVSKDWLRFDDNSNSVNTFNASNDSNSYIGSGTINTTTGENLNVRSGMGMDASILTSLKQGTKVNIIEPDNGSGWTKIQYGTDPNNTGYVYSKRVLEDDK